MYLEIGFFLVALAVMMADSEILAIPTLVMALGIGLIYKGGGFRYDNGETDEH